MHDLNGPLSRSNKFRTKARCVLNALVLLLATILPAHAKGDMVAPQINYSNEASFPISVGKEMLYVEDPSHTLFIEQVLSGNNIAWQPIQKASPNFGFTESAFWFRFDLVNQTASEAEVYLELPIPFLDNIKLYRFSEGAVLEKHYVGDERPFPERPINHQAFVMPFQLEPGTNQFAMRIESAGTVEAPLSVWSPKSFLVSDGNERLLQGVWFGVMGIMVLYNLFLLALLRDVSYLHYIGFTFSYLMFQGALKGYGFAYVWPEQLAWNSFAISVFIAASNLFALMFVSSFLDLAGHSRKVFKLISFIAGLSALMLALTFVLPYGITVRVNSAMSMVTCIVAATLGYWSWFNGNPLAKYFCLAWTSALGGIAILIAAKFGFVPSNFWTNNAAQIGIIAQVSLLSFALASRFTREKEMRIRAQDSSLEHERLARQTQEELLNAKADANAKLERKVAERTENLQKALSELETVNQKLEIMSTTDSLTGLFNRRHFENCFDEEFKRSVRHKRQLSIIICDIDHFKTINDQNGHQAGDECLQAISEILKQRISRSGDLVARYGGEEFIVLLSDTSMLQANEIAEDLRACIEGLSFEFDNKPIPVTASFGIASLNPFNVQSADQLVTQADVALYRAKDSGRNRALCWNANYTNPTSDEDISNFKA